jgi:hypothetical protein
MADLKVTVGADVSAYEAGMKQSAQATQAFSDDATKSLAQVAQASTAAGGAAASSSMKFMQMRSGISAARDGVMAFTLGGQAAERSLLAMGHHINSLVNETGSFKGALGALGSSLWGPGGIILGITVAVELFSKFSKGSKEAGDAAVDYASTLSAVRQATLAGQQAGDGEVTRLQILYAATQNHTLALKDRNAAYTELESKYPKYFTNADREKTLLGENTTGYNKLADAILAAAMAKAYEDKITSNTNRSLEDNQKILDAEKQIADVRAKLALDQKTNDEISKNATSGAGQGAGGLAISDSFLNKQLNDLIETRNSLLTDQLKLKEQNLALSKTATDEESKAGFKTAGEDGKGVKPDSTKDTSLKLLLPVGGVDFSYNPDDVKKALKKYQEQADKQLMSDAKNNSDKKLNNVDLQATSLVGTDKTLKNMDRIHQAIVRATNDQDTYDKEVANGTKAASDGAQLLSDIFNSIGQQGGNVFGSIITGIEQLLIKLAEAVAEAAVFALIMDALGFGSFSSLFLGSAGGSGALKQFTGFSIPGHADGGITLKPHLAMVGEGGENEVIAPLSKLKDFIGNSGGGAHNITVTGKLSGNDILISNKRTQASNSRRT